MKLGRTLTAGLFILGALIAPGVLGQDLGRYPFKPVRIVVPFPPGGPADVIARVIGQKLSDRWHQPVVIDNRPGGNGIIAADMVARSAPDGHTVLLTTDNALVMNQFLYKKLPYDPAKDLEPVAKLAVAPLVAITATEGPRNLQAAIAEARTRPGKVTFGYGTITPQLAGELLKSRSQAEIVSVAYKGSAATVQGLLSKDVTFIIDALTTSLPHVQSGRLRVLGNLGKRPIPGLVGVPTVADEMNLPDFDISVWLGLVVPRGTSQAVITSISSELALALARRDVTEKLDAVGLLPDYLPPAQFRTFIASESKRWRDVIQRADIRLD